LQQEWECGMCAEPHILAIFLQHACSATVMARPGSKHAKAGEAIHNTASNATPIANIRRII
jgi:hypothetical protein